MKLSREEAEEFLAEVHVGILSVPEEGRGPHTAPLWYVYERGEDVICTIPHTAKRATLIPRAARASLCVQDEAWPYRYVSVEGPIEVIGSRTHEDLVHVAQRYLGEEMGRAYAEQVTWGGLLIRLRPERWLSEGVTATSDLPPCGVELPEPTEESRSELGSVP